MHMDPVFRRFHHNQLTFGQLYAYTENFMLPLSHDEVVHGKGSLLDKMPGDTWQEFANLRLLFAYQYTSPGKKLNFMGNELAQGREWQARLGARLGAARDRLARRRAAHDARPESPVRADIRRCMSWISRRKGFAWIDCHDADQSTLSFLRRARDGAPVRGGAQLHAGAATRLSHRPAESAAPGARSSTATRPIYGGSNVGNGTVYAEPLPWMGLPYSAAVTLPPLAGIILEPVARMSVAPKLPVLFATSEVAPLIKTGGLADVAGSLPAALMHAGLDVRVLVPGYRQVLEGVKSRGKLAELSRARRDAREPAAGRRSCPTACRC